MGEISTVLMALFGIIFVMSGVTIFSRQNIRRFLRQRRTVLLLNLVRRVP